jgi:peptide/nickel transport system permease protein
MIPYILRRLVTSIPALFGVIFVVFALARLLPGDPCIAALGERATEAVCSDFNERNGLNEPIPVQFALYLGQLARFDLGESLAQGRPVTEILMERLPTTIELAVYALLFASVVGILLGLAAALRRNSKVDVGTMVGASLGVSIPIFVLALLLQFLFAVLLRGTIFQLPPSGRLSPGQQFQTIPEAWGLTDLGGLPRVVLDFLSNMYTVNFAITLQLDNLVDATQHLILPVIALGTISLAIIARITRSSLLEVLGLDYIRTARAKGVSNRSVIRRHAFRNALLPVVTIIGLQLGLLLAGAVLTETIFNLTGVGKTMFEAIQGRDYIVVQAFTIIIALIYLVVNLVVDVSYAFLDPRIRLE